MSQTFRYLGLPRATVNLVAPKRPHEGAIASLYRFIEFVKIIIFFSKKLFSVKSNGQLFSHGAFPSPARTHLSYARAKQLSLIANLGLRRATVNLVAPEKPHERAIASPYTFIELKKILKKFMFFKKKWKKKLKF